MYIAYASSGTTTSPWLSYGMIAVIFLALYFLTIRPQNKKEKELRNLRNSLKPGDEIITIGGIYGKIVRVTDDRVVIMVGSEKTKLELAKSAISGFAEAQTANVSFKKADKGDEPAEKEASKPTPKSIRKLGAAKGESAKEPETTEDKEA